MMPEPMPEETTITGCASATQNEILLYPLFMSAGEEVTETGFIYFQEMVPNNTGKPNGA